MKSCRIAQDIIRAGAIFALAAQALACAREPGTPAASAAPAAETTAVSPPAAAPRPVVLCVGTSLTAGYGLDPDDAWPAILQQKVDGAGLPHRVVNAGVSGETSAGALRRMDWLLRQPVAVLVVETGANDMLRGQDAAATRANLEGILARARKQSPPPRLVVLGMRATPNLGGAYVRSFEAIYPAVARAHDAVLVPFLLEGVAGVPRLNQADGVHPTAEGQKMLAETVWKTLEGVLRS